MLKAIELKHIIMSLWKSEMSRSESISWKKAVTSMLTNTVTLFTRDTFLSPLFCLPHKSMIVLIESRLQGKGKQSKITPVATPEEKCQCERVNCFLIVYLVEKNWHWTRGIPIERDGSLNCFHSVSYWRFEWPPFGDWLSLLIWFWNLPCLTPIYKRID